MTFPAQAIRAPVFDGLAFPAMLLEQGESKHYAVSGSECSRHNNLRTAWPPSRNSSHRKASVVTREIALLGYGKALNLTGLVGSRENTRTRFDRRPLGQKQNA